MKKKIILFVSIILLVGGGIGILSYFILGKSEFSFLGVSLEDATFKEVFTSSDDEFISGYIFKEGILYYLERKDINDEEVEYYLNTYDVKTKEKKSNKVSENTRMYCFLNEEYIGCSDNEKDYAYDLSLNKVKELEYEADNYYQSLIKYKNDYWEYYEGELKKDDEVIKIPGYDESFFYNDSLTLDNNTYLLLSSSDEYYIYNMNDDSLTNTEEEKYFKINDGYVFYSTTSYHLYDLSNNIDKKYDMNGLIVPKVEYFGDFSDNKIYQISNETGILEIYNVKKEKMASLDLSDYINYDIRNIYYYNNKLYLITTDDIDLEFISININNMNIKYMSVYDYIISQNKEIEEYVNKIKEEYNVNIKIKDEGEVYFPDFTSQTLYNNTIIIRAIKTVEDVLAKFPKSFFDNFKHDTYKGLNIYLGSTLTPSDVDSQASNPVAYTLMYNYSYTIVLDSTYNNLTNTVCHELMHVIENNLDNQNKKVFTNWKSLNPSGFSYYGSYNDYRDYNYTPYMTEDDNVYFASYYSYTYEIEDRAEIFGLMCSGEEEEIKKYPNLYKKAQKIKDELIANYPELSSSVFLNSY